MPYEASHLVDRFVNFGAFANQIRLGQHDSHRRARFMSQHQFAFKSLEIHLFGWLRDEH